MTNSPISVYRSWIRKIRAFQTVSLRRKLTAADIDDYTRQLRIIHSEALQTIDLSKKTRCFWKMENLTSEYLKTVGEKLDLRNPAIPKEVIPISHCGAGIAAAEISGFEMSRFQSLVDSISHPAYRGFCYEGIGAMMGVYQPGPFLTVSKAFKTMRVFQMESLEFPNPDIYLKNLEPEVRRLISHGFGRLKYFRCNTVQGAVKAVMKETAFDRKACIQGIAFAMVMVNSSDLIGFLRNPPRTGNQETDRALEEGLAYGLVFWEWMSPRFFEQLSSREESSGRIISRAKREIEISREKGNLKAFGFSD